MAEVLAFFKPHRSSTGRWLALLLLIILPFPISLPLALWLTRRDGSTHSVCIEAVPPLSSLCTHTKQSLRAA